MISKSLFNKETKTCPEGLSKPPSKVMGKGSGFIYRGKRLELEKARWQRVIRLSAKSISAYFILALCVLMYMEISTLSRSRSGPNLQLSSNHVRRKMQPSIISSDYVTTLHGDGIKENNTTRKVNLKEKKARFVPVSEELQITPESEYLLEQARNHVLDPLDTMDKERYTIRMNTWNRNEQLMTSINHHANCEGVAQIQIIWCNPDEAPPRDVVFHPSRQVVIEYHDVNSLNERFNILLTPPTRGILSLDDDVLRSCEALDNAFFKWTKAYDQIVGFDARLHGQHAKKNPDIHGWDYLGNHDTYRAKYYSIVLLRAAFLHRDYLDLYTNNMPKHIINFVAENFNCEDIAMSYLVSHLTSKPPLLADSWSIDSMIKLHSAKGISTGDTKHKLKRHYCVTQFAKELDLFSGQKKELKSYKLYHNNVHQRGAKINSVNSTAFISSREEYLNEISSRFTSSVRSAWRWNLQTSFEAMLGGLVPNTVPFEERIGKYRTKEQVTKEEDFLAIGMIFNNITEPQLELYEHIKYSLQSRPWFHQQCAKLMNEQVKSVMKHSYCIGLPSTVLSTSPKILNSTS